MSSGSARRLGYPRTSVWRLTLLFTLLVLLVNALVLGAVYWLTVSEQERQLQRNVLMAADTFRQLAAVERGSDVAVRRLVEAHARGAANTLLALESSDGVSGNLSELPRQLPRYPDTGRFPVAVSNLSGDATVELARGTWIEVGAGRLMVAQLEADQGAYRRDYLLASVLALVLALLLTLVAGYLFNRRQVRRLRDLSEGIEQIQRGRLDTRLPSRADGDEFDVLAGQVNQMLDEIDELLHSVAGVTDNIAHDLRTPLSRLRLRLDDIASALPTAPASAATETLGLAQADLDDLLQTFDAMLELARLEQGILQMEGRPCDLAAIARDAAELLTPLAEQRGQTVAVHCDGRSQVSGDASLLFRLIYNLLDNAIRHAGDKAHIHISQHGRQLCVADNGPGIPATERERVFRRLYRLDQSRHHPGTGLGLSVVRAIARLHGANITLGEAAPGLVVTLEFPPQEPL
ncbi:HAMP domain-containing sensor histidine kinase [Parahaliea mediterranea]|uniref:HAMP domain-containing sensor histidine kinase n=1 Tax=Parahaliea mediterranea TaxID=651086 RepID=UPI000E2F199B|nr:HAMP domain-containing sensor histidine kinase [Parahaliea mediterranea]